MFTKCYVIEINSSNEGMFDDLFDANIHNYKCHAIDNTHIEITFPNVKNVIELEEIIKRYM